MLILAEVKKIISELAVNACISNEYGFDLMLPYNEFQIFLIIYRNTVHRLAGILILAVQYRYWSELHTDLKELYHLRAVLFSADYQCVAGPYFTDRSFLENCKSIRESDKRHKEHLGKCTHNIVRDRHSLIEENRSRYMYYNSYYVSK